MQILVSVSRSGSVIYTVTSPMWFLYSVTFVQWLFFFALFYYFIFCLYQEGQEFTHFLVCGQYGRCVCSCVCVCTCVCLCTCEVIDIDVWFFFAFVPALSHTFSHIPPLGWVTHTHTRACAHTRAFTHTHPGHICICPLMDSGVYPGMRKRW